MAPLFRLSRLGLALLAALVASPAARAECSPADRAILLDHAERAVLEGRFDDYPGLSEQVDASLACGPRVEAPLAARLFLIEGARLHFSGAADGARLAFATAHGIAPELWNLDYGADTRAVYDAAVADRPTGRGTLVLETETAEGWMTAIDGALTPLPAEAPIGYHLVQVLEADGEARYATRVLILDPGERVVIHTGPLSARPQPVAAVGNRRPAWPLIAAGSAALLSGAAAGLALAQDGQMEAAGTKSDLNAAFGRQKAFAGATWGLAGLAASGVVVWLVW
jgi:hypothetical protein